MNRTANNELPYWLSRTANHMENMRIVSKPLRIVDKNNKMKTKIMLHRTRRGPNKTIVYKIRCKTCGLRNTSNYLFYLLQKECEWCGMEDNKPNIAIHHKGHSDEVGILNYDYETRTIEYDFEDESMENELREQLAEWVRLDVSCETDDIKDIEEKRNYI